MPTYAYACTDCEHQFETVQSFSEDSLTVCPECEGRLRKLFNAVGVVFKGGGFYRTDSRSDSGGSSTSSGSSGSSSTSGAESSGGSDAGTTSGSSGSSSSTAASSGSAASTAAG